MAVKDVPSTAVAVLVEEAAASWLQPSHPGWQMLNQPIVSSLLPLGHVLVGKGSLTLKFEVSHTCNAIARLGNVYARNSLTLTSACNVQLHYYWACRIDLTVCS